ncbi:hypothetical protein HK100_001990 [Physocladia obscura]|uniref:Centrosomal protein of 162 kDa n=1 Tax=Physocladia obscura TaxID=109957 RepID=A0AAD5XLH6_9FUNG|nr:hypothetical protein HK100_001990 [Physocladia obscura]
MSEKLSDGSDNDSSGERIHGGAADYAHVKCNSSVSVSSIGSGDSRADNRTENASETTANNITSNNSKRLLELRTKREERRLRNNKNNKTQRKADSSADDTDSPERIKARWLKHPSKNSYIEQLVDGYGDDSISSSAHAINNTNPIENTNNETLKIDISLSPNPVALDIIPAYSSNNSNNSNYPVAQTIEETVSEDLDFHSDSDSAAKNKNSVSISYSSPPLSPSPSTEVRPSNIGNLECESDEYSLEFDNEIKGEHENSVENLLPDKSIENELNLEKKHEASITSTVANFLESCNDLISTNKHNTSPILAKKSSPTSDTSISQEPSTTYIANVLIHKSIASNSELHESSGMESFLGLVAEIATPVLHTNYQTSVQLISDASNFIDQEHLNVESSMNALSDIAAVVGLDAKSAEILQAVVSSETTYANGNTKLSGNEISRVISPLKISVKNTELDPKNAQIPSQIGEERSENNSFLENVLQKFQNIPDVSVKRDTNKRSESSSTSQDSRVASPLRDSSFYLSSPDRSLFEASPSVPNELVRVNTIAELTSNSLLQSKIEVDNNGNKNEYVASEQSVLAEFNAVLDSSTKFPALNAPAPITLSEGQVENTSTAVAFEIKKENTETDQSNLSVFRPPQTSNLAIFTENDLASKNSFSELSYQTFTDFMTSEIENEIAAKSLKSAKQTSLGKKIILKPTSTSHQKSDNVVARTSKSLTRNNDRKQVSRSIIPASTTSAVSQIPRRRASNATNDVFSLNPIVSSTVGSRPSTSGKFPSNPLISASAKKAALDRTNARLKSTGGVSSIVRNPPAISSLTQTAVSSRLSVEKSSNFFVTEPNKNSDPCYSPSKLSHLPERNENMTVASIKQNDSRSDTPDLMIQLDGILSTGKALPLFKSSEPILKLHPQISEISYVSPRNLATSAIFSATPSHQPPPSLSYDLIADAIVEASAQNAATEILTLRKRLAETETEKSRMKEEIVFLEHLREQEAKINGLGVGFGGDTGLKEEKSPDQRELATKEDILRVKKEMEEQERLINGYQHENEKLTEQIKMLKRQLKDEDGRSFLRIEALQREIQTLKASMSNPASSGPLSFDSLKLAARVDELQEKLVSQERDFNERESNLLGQVNKLTANFAEANNKLESLKRYSVEEVDAMKSGWQEERNGFEAFIVQLESRIEREISLREMLVEKEQSALMKSPYGSFEVISSVENRLEPFKNGGNNTAGTKGKPLKVAGNDSKKIKDLERLVADLQDQLVQTSRAMRESAAQLVLTKKPNIEEATYIRHLKEHIKRLQSELETKETTWTSKLKILHEETTNLKSKYEAKLQEIHIRMEETQAASAQAIESATSVQSLASTTYLQDIEKQLENLLERYHEKLTEATDAEIADHLENAESRIGLAYKAREAKLRTRIVELENLVDSQVETMESMRADRTAAERDAQLRAQMKDALVTSYETKISSLRKEFHDRVFGGEEQKLLAEVHRLRMDIEILRGENSDLKNKLYVSEATRQSVHENTISILKQAQEESANIALSHHERALSMLRDETKSQTAALLDFEVRKLQKALSEAEVEITRWQNRVANLEQEKKAWKEGRSNDAVVKETTHKLEILEQSVKELQTLNADLQTQLQKSKSAWPPDRRRFGELEKMLGEMEIGFRKREFELQELIAATKKDANTQISREKIKYSSLLEKRDKELLYFRDQIYQLVSDLEKLDKRRT